MLQKLSNGAKGGISKFILVGFLFMAVAGLVLTDVGGFFRDGVSSTNVAEVGSEDVPYHEFDRFLRNALARQNISPQEAFKTGQVNQILNRYTQDILFVQSSEQFGIRTPDETVAKELHRFVKPFMTEDSTPQEALDIMLNQQGLTEENLVDAIRRDLTSNILKQAIMSGVETAPDVLTKELLRYENETRDIDMIKFPHNAVEIENQPTEEELLNVYNVSKMQFRIPERRGFTIAILDPKELTKDIKATEEDLRTYYDNNKIRYEVAAGRKIEQAVFETEEAANTFIESLENPESFKSAAGDNYREANVYQEENAPEALKEILFSEDESNIRGPAQSPFGWHVIHDLGDVETTYRPFEDVKETIRIVLERDQKRDVMVEAMETINDRLDDEEPLDTIVSDYKMETLDLSPVDQFGTTLAGDTGLKSFEEDQAILLENLFDLYEDEPSEIIELKDGRLAILKIKDVIAESIQPFEDVKNQIKERLISDRQRLANREQTQNFIQQLQNNEKTLDQIAAETGLKVEKRNNIKRGFEEEDLKEVSFELKARIFLTNEGDYFTAQAPDGIIIAKSDNRRLQDTELTKETEGLAQRLTIVDTMTTFYNHLADETPVRVNQGLLEQLYGEPRS